MLTRLLDIIIPGRRLSRTLAAIDQAAKTRKELGYEGLAFARPVRPVSSLPSAYSTVRGKVVR